MRTRGEGVKKSENFEDFISGLKFKVLYDPQGCLGALMVPEARRVLRSNMLITISIFLGS